MAMFTSKITCLATGAWIELSPGAIVAKEMIISAPLTTGAGGGVMVVLAALIGDLPAPGVSFGHMVNRQNPVMKFAAPGTKVWGRSTGGVAADVIVSISQ